MKFNKKLMKYTMNYISFVWKNMNNYVNKKKFRIFKKINALIYTIIKLQLLK